MNRTILPILFLAMMIIAGCTCKNLILPDTVPLQDPKDQKTSESSQVLLMAKEVVINMDTLEYEVFPVPIRNTTALGDFLGDLEITSFLSPPFCTDNQCLNVTSLTTTGDNIDSLDSTPDILMDVKVCHPFPKFNASLPVSGKNRADLDLFDVRTYIVHDGDADDIPANSESGIPVAVSYATNTMSLNEDFIQGSDGYDSGADGILVNAIDGLSASELQELQTYNQQVSRPPILTTVQPYQRYFEGIGNPADFIPGSNPVSGDNRMSHGECDTGTFQLNVGPGQGEVKIFLAVTGSYGQSAAGKDNRTPELVQYSVPGFRKDGYFVVFGGTGSTWPPAGVEPVAQPPATLDVDLLYPKADMLQSTVPTSVPSARVFYVFQAVDPANPTSDFQTEATYSGWNWLANQNSWAAKYGRPISDWVATSPTAPAVYRVIMVVDSDGNLATHDDVTARLSPKFLYEGTGPVTHDVSIQGFAFNPGQLSINVGDTVRWTNNDSVSHTVTSGISPVPDGIWDSGPLANGQTFERMFTSTGTFNYYCSIHTSMTGQISVN